MITAFYYLCFFIFCAKNALAARVKRDDNYCAIAYIKEDFDGIGIILRPSKYDKGEHNLDAEFAGKIQSIELKAGCYIDVFKGEALTGDVMTISENRKKFDEKDSFEKFFKNAIKSYYCMCK